MFKLISFAVIDKTSIVQNLEEFKRQKFSNGRLNVNFESEEYYKKKSAMIVFGQQYFCVRTTFFYLNQYFNPNVQFNQRKITLRICHVFLKGFPLSVRLERKLLTCNISCFQFKMNHQ